MGNSIRRLIQLFKQGQKTKGEKKKKKRDSTYPVLRNRTINKNEINVKGQILLPNH